MSNETIVIPGRAVRLQKIASKDETRFGLTGVHLTPTCAEATDGRRLVRMEWQKDDGAKVEEPILLQFTSTPAKAIKLDTITLERLPSGWYADVENGVIAKVAPGTFPDTTQVLDSVAGKRFVTALNHHLLSGIATAVGMDRNGYIELSVGANADGSPVMVTPIEVGCEKAGTRAVLMPMRRE